MSTGYEVQGRTRQKQRTRGALIAAARELLAAGVVPTVDQAAEAASISRTTAYRYFSSQGALLLAAHPELTAESLLPLDAPDDVRAKLDAVVAALTDLTLETEAPLRAMLRLSLSPGAPTREQMTFRRGRAIAWLDEALETAFASVEDRRRLACAIRSAIGIESLVWLTDVAGLDREEAVAIQRWTARSLLRAALEDGPPPATKRPSRSRKKPKRRGGRDGG